VATTTATVTDANGKTVPAGSTLIPGQRLTVSAGGFAAGETVAITVQSTPVTVGSAVASATGQVTASIALPTTLDAGAHTITLTGTHAVATFAFNVQSDSSGSGSSGSGSSGSGSTGSGSSSSGSSSGSLPTTGTPTLRYLVFGLGFVLFGAAVVVIARDRRRTAR